MRRRSQLYVPGNNERMIRKSSELAADSVVLDWEDAVPPPEKEEAKRLLRKLSNEISWPKRELCVRVNGLDTPWGMKDLLDASNFNLDTIVIPKAETALSFVRTATGKNVIPLIETGRGLLKMEEIVRSEGVEAVSYGVGDFAAAMGGEIHAYESSMYLKTRVVTIAKAYGVDAIDRVFFDIKNLPLFKSDAFEAKKLGFVGKQVIHPDQVTAANEVFTPAVEELEWSRKVVKAYDEATKGGRGAISLEGKLIDAVHYRIAKKTLENAEA
ncbi:MAG: CoA ester lyase [Thaumarchaeota archaeon]|nr:CoA ester lyase [Nitrososphaerota archaeon]